MLGLRSLELTSRMHRTQKLPVAPLHELEAFRAQLLQQLGVENEQAVRLREVLLGTRATRIARDPGSLLHLVQAAPLQLPCLALAGFALQCVPHDVTELVSEN